MNNTSAGLGAFVKKRAEGLGPVPIDISPLTLKPCRVRSVLPATPDLQTKTLDPRP
jgi:hypothetical protein